LEQKRLTDEFLWAEAGLQEKEKTMTKAKPTTEIRIGKVKAAVWANENGGIIRYNVSVSRLYKDGTTWKRSDSFGRDDLLTLAELADQVHSVLHQQLPESEEEPTPAPAA
jgi:hypothetical protein